MKRRNLVLGEDLLEEALRLSGEKTYSRAVERALEEYVRRARARQILQLHGSGLWKGDLGVMREDQPVPRDAGNPRRYSPREQRPRDLRHLDLIRPGVDLQHLGVAAELLDLELGHVAVAAEELDGLEGDLHRGLRGVELARRRLGELHRLAGGGHLDQAEDEVLQVHPRDLHLGELQLDELELADRAAELHAGARVVDRARAALLDDAERHRGDAGALHGERLLRAGAGGR